MSKVKEKEDCLTSFELKCIEKQNYSLYLQAKSKLVFDDIESREVAQDIDFNVCLDLWADGSEATHCRSIGYITGYKVIGLDIEKIVEWADSKDQCIYDAFIWLTEHQDHIFMDEVCCGTIFYTEQVEIQKKWRGFGFALKALVTCLDFVACDFNFCIPFPLNAQELTVEQIEKQQDLLRRYWMKAGFSKYDPESNILSRWECPEWLKAKH